MLAYQLKPGLDHLFDHGVTNDQMLAGKSDVS
jgi:hypothetical protein